MFEVVIFDLDGLLVDSEPLQFQAYRDAFANNGIILALDDWPQWHSLEASATRWVAAHNLPVNAEKIRAEKKILYEALIEKELTLKPGAGQLVEALARHCRLCVASGSRSESIEACLNRFSLTPYFEQQFSATQLERKKPYPDVYLEALSKMQVSPQRTLAIEDSVTGLQAATSAGISCVVCPDSFVPTSLSDYDGATLVVDSLEELTISKLEQLASEGGGA
jgi:HAD superfamily hydrolase (TIGR01509 family)